MFTTRCPRCQSQVSVPLNYEGKGVQCTVCQHPFVAINQPGSNISLSGKAVRERQRQRELGTLNVTPPPRTRWTKATSDGLTEVATLTERLNECHAHMDEYPCSYCNVWVKPFFDYERVSSGGVGITNQYGVTLVRQNVSTRERVRCRECGKLLGTSGADRAKEYSDKLRTAQSQLARLARREQRWLELRELARTRPGYAAFLELCDLFVPAMIIILLCLGLMYLIYIYEVLPYYSPALPD